ncbi:MAG: 6-phosphofructokinase [Planctomycetes bacterium]|nr:6-phosphofructokinase [Planctomycetota bacterium]MCB9891916.1 6-phosphofructokinase [Planctomycetota bacterium]
MSKGTVGILVGGGPAPGINSVIGSATIEARKRGFRVIGILHGFKNLIQGNPGDWRELEMGDVSRIHLDGGSILRTSRANPTKSQEFLDNTVKALRGLGVDRLITIGGDDTASSAAAVARASNETIAVAHVPKTIDNDLPLPGGKPTFGFSTARHLGSELVSNLMEDSLTTGRWYTVVTMGRKAGHLALGIGVSAGATVTLIPEEFAGKPTMRSVCDILDGAMIKRVAMGREDGVAILAEGLAEGFTQEELESIADVRSERDPHGHIRHAEVDLAGAVRKELNRRWKERGRKITIVEKELGYELRCAPPIPFDIQYTRSLGFAAARYVTGLEAGKSAAAVMVCLDEDGCFDTVPLEKLREDSGRVGVRLVDRNSEAFLVARNYMIRLEDEDFEDAGQLGKLASVAGMTSEEFAARYRCCVDPARQPTA